MMNNIRHASAIVSGSNEYPGIYGTVKFVQKPIGVLVTANINDLPTSEGHCGGRFFGFHIHEGNSCTGNESDPFADTKGHYNPNGCEHPNHAGDLPPLFSCNGYSYMSFITDRISVDEIIGKTVVIHSMSDDFKTQPSGDSGMKIACGVIMV